jgi:hypothetical protein
MGGGKLNAVACMNRATAGALGFQAEAALALVISRNPAVTHGRAHLACLYFVETVVDNM